MGAESHVGGGPYGEKGPHTGALEGDTPPHPLLPAFSAPGASWASGRTAGAQDSPRAPGKELAGEGKKQRSVLASDPAGLRPLSTDKAKSCLKGSAYTQAQSRPWCSVPSL